MVTVKTMKNRGATLIEVIIAVAIIGAVLAVVGGLFFRGCIPSQSLATDQANRWAREMRIPDPSVSCASYDTDGDGYVSCSVSSRNGQGTVQIIPVECAARFTLNDGCRSPKAIVRTGAN